MNYFLFLTITNILSSSQSIRKNFFDRKSFLISNEPLRIDTDSIADNLVKRYLVVIEKRYRDSKFSELKSILRTVHDKSKWKATEMTFKTLCKEYFKIILSDRSNIRSEFGEYENDIIQTLDNMDVMFKNHVPEDNFFLCEFLKLTSEDFFKKYTTGSMMRLHICCAIRLGVLSVMKKSILQQLLIFDEVKEHRIKGANRILRNLRKEDDSKEAHLKYLHFDNDFISSKSEMAKVLKTVISKIKGYKNTEVNIIFINFAEGILDQIIYEGLKAKEDDVSAVNLFDLNAILNIKFSLKEDFGSLENIKNIFKKMIKERNLEMSIIYFHVPCEIKLNFKGISVPDETIKKTCSEEISKLIQKLGDISLKNLIYPFGDNFFTLEGKFQMTENDGVLKQDICNKESTKIFKGDSDDKTENPVENFDVIIRFFTELKYKENIKEIKKVKTAKKQNINKNKIETSNKNEDSSFGYEKDKLSDEIYQKGDEIKEGESIPDGEIKKKLCFSDVEEKESSDHIDEKSQYTEISYKKKLKKNKACDYYLRNSDVDVSHKQFKERNYKETNKYASRNINYRTKSCFRNSNTKRVRNIMNIKKKLIADFFFLKKFVI